jgi:hypothetical protein
VKHTSYEAPHFAPFSNFPYFLPPRSKYFPQQPVSNTLNLCSSLSVRDQVSHPYKITGKIMVMYILIFKVLERRQEDKRLS